jgi:nitroimidazol reductase NimA-like FMN-containing flavoprotein (pyridoxamine 5'-phosphate oxidase superfamily)
MKMRRADREITTTGEKLGIIGRCKVCRLGMADGEEPYIVPLNFGYEYTEGTLLLYFHSAREGRKIDILRKNRRACFEMDGEYRLIEGDTACEYGFSYESVTGLGLVEFIEDREEKVRALNLLMRHQTGEDRDFDYQETQLDRVAVYRLRVESFTGKHRPAPVKRS